MIPYHEFRTGLTFKAVREMLAHESHEFCRRTGQYMFVGRRTVLGRWRQYKLEMYEAYLADLRSYP